jgi:hypothetical protein
MAGDHRIHDWAAARHPRPVGNDGEDILIISQYFSVFYQEALAYLGAQLSQDSIPELAMLIGKAEAIQAN